MDVEWFRRRIRPLAFFLTSSSSSSLVVRPSPLISFLFSFPTLLRLSLFGLSLYPFAGITLSKYKSVFPNHNPINR